MALFSFVGSPDSFALVIMVLVSSTSFPILSLLAIISAILFVKRRVIIGTKVFLAFCSTVLANAFLAFAFSALVLVLRFFNFYLFVLVDSF